MKTRVVNIRTDTYDVYIGRPSRWGNPFSIGRHGDREHVIEMYRAWIFTQRDLLCSLGELKGKRLGCFCAPKPCHGDILAQLAADVDIAESKEDESKEKQVSSFAPRL